MRTAGDAPKAMHKAMPEAMPNAMPEAMPKAMPKAMPEAMPVMPKPTRNSRKPPTFSPKNTHMPSSTTSGEICAMAVTSAIGIWASAVMKQRMATSSLAERSSTQGWKAWGSDRMSPSA